ncbi:MAG: glycoside hydrolase family 9 protein [Limnochordaceae bacterium]|nr:glycoside hydrolase family 9 protein [Limnochordaceae bacterium]
MSWRLTQPASGNSESRRAIYLPGLLVGGPNSHAEDKVAPGGRGPLSYIDVAPAYSVNEPAIDYNAPLVFTVGYLLAALPHENR